MIRIFVEYDDDDEEHTAIRIAEIIRKHNSIPAVFVKVTQKIVEKDLASHGGRAQLKGVRKVES